MTLCTLDNALQCAGLQFSARSCRCTFFACAPFSQPGRAPPTSGWTSSIVFSLVSTSLYNSGWALIVLRSRIATRVQVAQGKIWISYAAIFVDFVRFPLLKTSWTRLETNWNKPRTNESTPKKQNQHNWSNWINQNPLKPNKKQPELRPFIKHCQRHYRPRCWLLWPVILVW